MAGQSRRGTCSRRKSARSSAAASARSGSRYWTRGLRSTASTGSTTPPPFPPPQAAGLYGERNSIARLASRSTIIVPADTSPSPPFRGEREGPDPQGWEGEVGGATNRLVAPLTLPSPPGQRGERVKGASSEPRFGRKSSNSRSLHFPRTALRLRGGVVVSLSASVGRLRHRRYLKLTGKLK